MTDEVKGPETAHNMSELERLLRSIKPGRAAGRKCTIVGCYGNKGWHSITETKLPDGTKKTTVNICCGEIGKSDYAMIDQRIGTIERAVQGLADKINLTMDRQFDITRAVVRHEGRIRPIKWLHAFRGWQTARRMARKAPSVPKEPLTDSVLDTINPQQ